MKKVTALLLMLTLVFTLSACTGEQYEIAMITDVGDIDDESFNQGTWEGVKAYAEENDISYDYYKPAEKSDSAYINTIELAIDNGAEVVVTPGFLFSPAIGEMQSEYPEVTFILLDAEPVGGVADNTVSVYYAEHESGFLAGYAAVNDGFTDLGYMGGMAVPAVVRFGIGYVAGAYYAADEMDVSLTFPDDRYTYLGTFAPGDTVNTMASSWFSAGTEVIFAAAGGAGSSVMNAAENQDAWMIGVDVDQSGNSERVLTSATKALANSVQDMLDRYYNDDFPGGQTLRLGAAEDGVSLPMDSARFDETDLGSEFTQSDYDAIYGELADGTVTAPSTYAELVTFFDDNNLNANALDPDNTDADDGIEANTVEPPQDE